MGARACENCGEQQPELRKCVRCKNVFYCSKVCQKQHWMIGHKDRCTPPSGQDETQAESCDRVEVTDPQPICSYCKNSSQNLFYSGCKSIYYCSKSCQEEDRIKHKHKMSRKSTRPQTKVTETLSTADCSRLGLVTPEEHKGMNRNDGNLPFLEEDRKMWETFLCSKCRKNEVTVDCPLCTTSLYCSTDCRELDKTDHQEFCYVAQTLMHNKILSGMSYTTGFVNGEMAYGYSPVHARLPNDQNPCLVQDGADLDMVIERTGRARDNVVVEIKRKYPCYTLITRIREIPVEETSMFATNLCPKPLVFLSYIRRFHRYRGRHNVYLQDSDRREIYVSFYLPNDDPSPYFQWSDIVPGKFIAILFPCIHFFNDETVGIRVDKASYVNCLDVED